MRFAFRVGLVIACCLLALMLAVFQQMHGNKEFNRTLHDSPGGIFKFPSAVLQWIQLANASRISPGKENAVGRCTEKKHIAFLKVPKAGSSTVQNIFFRFGTLRWLIFALPYFANYISHTDKVRPYSLIPPPRGEKKYDIMCNHVLYNRSTFAALMYEDAAYIGILREPLSQLESYIYYYHHDSVTKDDKLTEYLENPDEYIRKNRLMPNPQTDYYGISASKRNDPNSIERFISKIEKEFDFIVILERFDESMLLLKRRLCWALTDLLYVRKNTNFANPRKARSHTQQNKHKQLALAEYLFYEHFHHNLLEEIAKEGVDFQHELDHYRGILRSVNSFCLDGKRQWGSQFYIPASAWNPATNITAAVCYIMMLPELQLQELVGRRQYGDDKWKMTHQTMRPWKNNDKLVNQVLQNGDIVKRRFFNAKQSSRYRW